jgi:hypothetical protein
MQAGEPPQKSHFQASSPPLFTESLPLSSILMAWKGQTSTQASQPVQAS